MRHLGNQVGAICFWSCTVCLSDGESWETGAWMILDIVCKLCALLLVVAKALAYPGKVSVNASKYLSPDQEPMVKPNC